ncbi:MAG: YhbY family RNA-binding protein [Defluviitaleaceae bacterium]|nr:YhbY family RNA-binding protein [Defluviitaleaceae bacterium]
MTSKQRAFLRALANRLDATHQVGKAGVSPELCAAVDDVLEKRELVKISVLQNAEAGAKDAAEMLGGRTRSQVVCVIGSKFVLYRQAGNEQNRRITLPK